VPLPCLGQDSTSQRPFYYFRQGQLPPEHHCPASGRATPRNSYFTTSGKGGCLPGAAAQPQAGQHLTTAILLPQARATAFGAPLPSLGQDEGQV